MNVKQIFYSALAVLSVTFTCAFTFYLCLYETRIYGIISADLASDMYLFGVFTGIVLCMIQVLAFRMIQYCDESTLKNELSYGDFGFRSPARWFAGFVLFMIMAGISLPFDVFLPSNVIGLLPMMYTFGVLLGMTVVTVATFASLPEKSVQTESALSNV